VRYRPLRFHAKGGLGEVFVAQDEEVHRQVALKRMQPRHADDLEIRRRFLREAEITGRLEHPGIVPVYGVVQGADGQPCYAMRFIQGDSLHQTIQDFHQADKGKRDPGERSMALRQLLQRFISVCNTIAYAHSRGVIHRDLKPGNIMLGKYGETLVVDWGLARTFERGEHERSSGEETLTPAAGGEGETRLGQAQGTPAYMSPEQAAGRWDVIGPATDVYSLGATLYALLTGRAPFQGRNPAEVLQQAQRGKMVPPRQVKKEVPPALEAVCLKAMALKPEERYATAQDLGADIEPWLADEPVSAYREPWRARLRRWVGRRRTLVTSTGVALLLLVLGGGAASFWYQQQLDAAAARQQEAERKARDRMYQAQAVLETAWHTADLPRLAEAQAQADQAVEIAARASDAVQQEAARLQAEIKARIRATQKNRALLNVIQPQETRTYEKGEGGVMAAIVLPSAEQQFASAFRHWDAGLDFDRTPSEQIVAQLQAQPEPVVQEVVAALDEWALERRRRGRPEDQDKGRRLLEVAERLDRNDRRKEVRRLLAASPQKLTPATAVQWDKVRADLRHLSTKMDERREPVLGLLSLARVLQAFEEEQTAERLLRSAVAVHRSEAVLLFTLGKFLEQQNPPRLEEAIGCYRAACAVRPQLGVALGLALVDARRAGEGEAVLRDLARREPNNPEMHFYLGLALAKQKRLDEAVTAYHKALALLPDFALVYYNLGRALAEQQKLHEAAAAFQKTLAFRPDFPEAYYGLGITLYEQKKLDRAVEAFQKAIALRPNYAEAYNTLGIALTEQKKLDDAVTAYQKAIALQPDSAIAYSNLGLALREQKKLPEAVGALQKALALRPDFARAYHNLGNVLLDQKKPGEAVAAHRKALALSPALPEAYLSLGVALEAQGKLNEAAAAYQKALAAQPDLAKAYHNLGNVRLAQKKLDEAVAAYHKAITLRPDYADAYHNLAAALYQQKKPDEAVAALKKTIALRPDSPEGYYGLGAALQEQKKLDEAIAAYHKAITLRPDYPSAYYNLGAALQDQKKLEEAVKAFRKAIALRPDYAEAYNRLGNTLLEQKKLDEAVAVHKKLIALRPDDALAYNNLGAALRAQKKLADAVAAFRKAEQLLPGHPTLLNNLRLVERWLRLDQKLPAVLAGKEAPQSAEEWLELADFCVSYKQCYTAAARCFSGALTVKPSLAAPILLRVRYDGACVAGLAAGGQGEDAGKLAAKEKVGLRQQALAWLQDNLKEYAKHLEGADAKTRQAVRQTLQRWQKDAALDSVRDKEALAKLPEADRAAWQQLWADVEQLLKKGAP
jgi:tetratricopeptide (TPR) repeat protein/tRNA A-37 threonylcarbamoyl transferase component Bud32